MNILFKPCVALMNRLSYLQKFALITLLFLLPLGLVIWVFFPDIDANLNFISKEKAGLNVFVPLRQLSYDLSQARMTAEDYLAGNVAIKADLQQKLNVVDKDFAALRTTASQNLADLDLTSDFDKLLQAWQTLEKKQFDLKKDDSDKQYEALLQQISNLTLDLTDHSNLILDPTLNSYYLIIATTDILPNDQDTLLNGLFNADKLVTGEFLTQDEQSQLMGEASVLQSNSQSLNRSFNTIFGANPELKPQLNPALQAYLNFSKSYQQMYVNRYEFGGGIPNIITFGEFQNLTNDGLTASANLWKVSISALRQTLDARYQAAAFHKTAFQVMSTVVLILVFYLWYGFYLAVTRTVVKLKEAANRMTTGQTQEILQIENRDELGRITKSFNQIATALIATSNELRKQQQESREVSGQVLEMAMELRATVQQQKQGTQMQASSVSQVYSSMSELSAAADSIAELAKQIRQAAERTTVASLQIDVTVSDTDEQSHKGLVAVGTTAHNIKQSTAFYGQLVEQIKGLETKSVNMRRIIAMIGDISDETHILALNAAIEAAGAGQFGSRFAVIADEVRELARRSQQFSQQIVQIVNEIDQDVALILPASQNGYQQSLEIEQAADQAGAVIWQMTEYASKARREADSINHLAKAMKQLSDIIEVATHQQQAASREILETLNGLSSVAQQTASGSEVVAYTANQMETIAGELNVALAAVA